MVSAMKLLTVISLAISAILFSVANDSVAQTAPPPTLGEETKGQPAINERQQLEPKSQTQSTNTTSNSSPKDTNLGIADSLLGTAKITESRRESGQVYRIELEHSSGSTQVLEENDSDGRLSSDNKGLEDAPKITKWRLGSW